MSRPILGIVKQECTAAGHVRILYLALDVKLSDVSGDAIHVKEATRALSSLGEEVFLVVPASGTTADEVAELARQRVHPYLITATGTLRPADECRRLAQECRPDVIYERRFSPKVGAMVSFALGIPLIVEVNGLVDVEATMLGRTPRGGRLANGLRGIVRGWAYQQATLVVAVTAAIGRELQDRYGLSLAKTAIIPNGADIEAFRPSDATEAKKALNIPESRPVVCFVGTLLPWQGLDHMLNAAHRVVMAAPDALFLIVGDGPLVERLRSEVSRKGLDNSFRIEGRVRHVDVPRYINAADVCLALKDPKIGGFETGFSPLKLYEYLACGRPVVATRTSGFEILEEAGCGILVDPLDTRAVADAIVEVLMDNGQRTEMGKRARAVAVDQFSWLAVAKQTVGAMRTAMARQT